MVSNFLFFPSVSCSFGETTRKEKETETETETKCQTTKINPDITQQINKWYYHFVCLSVTQFEVHSICEPSFSQQNEAAAAHKNSKQTIKYGACILHTPPRPSEISETNWSTYIDKAIFDIPFMTQSHAESMKKILVAFKDLPAN